MAKITKTKVDRKFNIEVVPVPHTLGMQTKLKVTRKAEPGAAYEGRSATCVHCAKPIIKVAAAPTVAKFHKACRKDGRAKLRKDAKTTKEA